MEVSDAALDCTEALRDDFELYARNCLKIRTKEGGIVPFELNAAQRYVHERIEEQRARLGRVRVLVLKARQWGCSTYVEGRYYHKVSLQSGVRAFILTHTQDATNNLFGMTDRFHTHCPDDMRPATGAANAKELNFNRLDSGFGVATAGSKAVGRSDTIQYFHGSEVAFWPNAEEHMTGAMRAVPKARGTEIVLESTARGVGGLFYNLCKKAEGGGGEYELIFVPWHLHEEYQAEPPEGWVAPSVFREYAQVHDLTEAQTYWAWRENSDLASAENLPTHELCWRFKQEYPATAEEAFQTSGRDSFIPSEAVAKARNAKVPDQTGSPLLLGVDIARGGGDKTRIVDRLGRCAGHLVNEVIDSADLMEVAGRIARIIDRHKPDGVFIDVTGLGAGVYDRLRERHYRNIHPVNFGSKASDPRYANKRAEMWGRMGEWFVDPGGVDIVDDAVWHTHICAPWVIYNSNSATQLAPKKEIKAVVGFSPDAGDALGLTFAEGVHRRRGDPGAAQANNSYNPLSY
ncbi:MAG: hypothetical protein GY953_39365 [bacterium]|nr:hypothetical protein [bacterium]